MIGTVTFANGYPILVQGEARTALLGPEPTQRVRIVRTLANPQTTDGGGAGPAIRVTKVIRLA
jgi:hypothetical protein